MPGIDSFIPNWDLLVDEYIRRGGIICPYCQSHDIVRGRIEIAGDQVAQQIHCENCDKRWRDIYTLSDIEEEVL